MGKLNYDPTIQHFSHYHPLQLLNTNQHTPNLALCAGCKVAPSGWIYSCKSCNYNLHISCSQMPLVINHPADPNHALSLLVSPAYPEGRFNCDACGRQGNGFSYHCNTCNLDIHTLCASAPLSVNHQTHSHTLNLTFFPPYQAKGFSCDICHKMGSNHWLYRCTTCEFDAHIGCATAKPSAPQQHQHLLAKPSVPQQQHQHLVQHQYQSFPASNHIQTHFKLPGTQVGSTVPLYQPIVVQSNPLTSHSFPGYCHTQYQHQGAGRAGGMQRPPARQQGDSLMQMAIESFVDAASQQAGQTAVQDLMGIGGNGADPSSFLNIEW